MHELDRKWEQNIDRNLGMKFTWRSVEVVRHRHPYGRTRSGSRGIPRPYERLWAPQELGARLSGCRAVRGWRRPQRRVGKEAGRHSSPSHSVVRGRGPRVGRRVSYAVHSIPRIDEAVIVEGLRLRRVLAGVPALGRRAIEVPEDAPPRVQEARGLPEGYVLLPADLREEGLRGLLRAHVQQVLVHVERELLPRLRVRRHRGAFALRVHRGRAAEQEGRRPAGSVGGAILATAARANDARPTEADRNDRSAAEADARRGSSRLPRRGVRGGAPESGASERSERNAAVARRPRPDAALDATKTNRSTARSLARVYDRDLQAYYFIRRSFRFVGSKFDAKSSRTCISFVFRANRRKRNLNQSIDDLQRSRNQALSLNF